MRVNVNELVFFGRIGGNYGFVNGIGLKYTLDGQCDKCENKIITCTVDDGPVIDTLVLAQMFESIALKLRSHDAQSRVKE